MTLSTAESEYVQATLARQEVLALRQLLERLRFKQTEPTKIWEDNTAAIDLSVNPCSCGHTKHIKRRWHFMRQCDANREVILCKISGTQNPADTFTKALHFEMFVFYRTMLGVVPFTEHE